MAVSLNLGGFLFEGVLVRRAKLFAVYLGVPDFLTLLFYIDAASPNIHVTAIIPTVGFRYLKSCRSCIIDYIVHAT